MPSPTPAGVALRNGAAVLTILGLVQLLKRLRRKSQPKAVETSAKDLLNNEAVRCALASGMSTLGFGKGMEAGSPVLAVLLGQLPLRTLMRNRSYICGYDSLASYMALQTLIAKVPAVDKHPALSMMISAGELLSAWFLHDDHLPVGYIRFLHSASKISQKQHAALRQVYTSGTGKLREVVPLVLHTRDEVSLPVKYGCTWTGLNKAALEFCIHQCMKDNFFFYVKVFSLRVIAQLLGHGTGIGREILRVLTSSPIPLLVGGLRMCKDAARSAVFLSLYATLYQWSMGATGLAFPDATAGPAVLWLSTTLGGAAVIVDSLKQQRTIANYCATFAMYSVLSRSPVLFDLAFAGAGLAAASGKIRTPMLVSLLWSASMRAPETVPA
eukprot:TRINITY_DN17643_c0_g1_i2.p1 TRINITY_DN17643_c0_g1~~TRINITY_DN17643_c0_g1_i2.p1  ORF type:complete len:384 (+),score=104.09 TRINITY_DN17643_c0_g1_i2:84-1235(+)